VNGGQLLRTGNIFENSAYAGVVQDKQPPGRLTAASHEPATAEEKAVGQKGGQATAATTLVVNRPTHHGSETRRTDQVTGRVAPHIKALLLRIGKAHGWKESKTVAVACQAYLEQDLGEKFGVRLAAIVTDAIEKEIQKISKRLEYFSLHGYYASEENRIISSKVYRYLFGEETEIYQQTLKQARSQAYTNIKRPLEDKV
jgi:hypothetical protein